MGLEILRVENIEEKYQAQNGEVTALENISFSMDKGEFMSIVGPSGCGKSTLLSILAGLLKPTAGAVYVKGEKVEGISGHIGYMLQKDSLLDWRTIYSNVLFGLEVRHMLTQETVDRAVQLLKTYGLYEFKDKYPAQLSGGMRQRAALIRTLAINPDILLLDEAFRPGLPNAPDRHRGRVPYPQAGGDHHRHGHPRHSGKHQHGRPDSGAHRPAGEGEGNPGHRFRHGSPHPAVLPEQSEIRAIFRPHMERTGDACLRKPTSRRCQRSGGSI